MGHLKLWYHKRSIKFWNVSPYSLVQFYRHFKWIYCLHVQDRRIIQASSISQNTLPSSAGVAQSIYWLDYGMDERWTGVRFLAGSSDCLLTTTQPPIKWIPGVLSSEVKRLGIETDHEPTSSVDVENLWSYTSTIKYVFVARCLIKCDVHAME
jgi:hypothetical protein